MSNDKLDRFNPLAEDAAPALPAFEMDPAEYMDDLEGFDMTEAQKIELLQTLWSIMGAFVELGFTTNICEQLFEDSGLLPTAAPEDVESKASTKTEKPARGAQKESSDDR